MEGEKKQGKDFYKVLGLERTATEVEIQQTYRKLYIFLFTKL